MENNYDFTHCVKALSGALLLSGKALQIEIAVAFIVFHKIGSTTATAKKALRQVYTDAGGRDCMTPDAPAYQTAVRRINRTAALFEIIGWRKVKKVLKNLEGAEAISAVIEMLAPLDLRNMDDVAAYAGRPRKNEEEEPGETAPDENEEVEVIHVKTKHLDLAVPTGTTPQELMRLANKLIALAQEMEGVTATKKSLAN